MTTHHQTVLIPLPQKKIPMEKMVGGRGHGRRTDNRVNIDINSIVSFFE